MMNDAYDRTAQEQQVAALLEHNEKLAAELRARKQQVAAFSRCKELLRAELRTSKQQVAVLSHHSEQVAAELAETKTKALQHQEESSTLRREMEVLQNKVETAGQEKQDLETQRTEVLEQRQSPTTVSSWTTRETDEDTNGYVVPPVDIPTRYRTRDLQGGNDVGGNYVIFTYGAFKRRQQRMHHLRPIPERTDAGDLELSGGMEEATPEVVSKSAEAPAQTQQLRSRKRSSEEISDADDRLQQLRRKLNSCLASARELPASGGMKEAAPAKMNEVASKSTEVPVQTQQRFGWKRASEEIGDADDRLRLLRRRLDTCLANAAARA